MGVLLGQALMGTYRTGAIGHAKERILVGVGVGVFASALGPVTIASATQLKTALVFGALLLPLITLWRYAAGKLVRLAQRMGVGRKRTLIVGTDEAAWRMINHFRRRDESGLNIIGHLCDAGDSSPAAIGATDELPAMIERHDIEHVLVADGVEPDVYKRIASESLLRGATVGVISGLFDEEVARTSFRGVAGWPALQLRMSGAEMLQVAAKRSFDIVASSVILILASPVMAAVALAIRLDSRGPILFSQRRPGLGGRDFRMYKFRSMRCDAEAILAADPELTRAFLENGCKFPNGKDPRISRVGGFLRSSSLDELPQLFNVLLGDMSLVGPRPVLGPEFEQFGDLVSVILSVKPGMTGLWQVSGRSTVAGKDRAALDAQYVAGWSLALDARILARTIPVVWKGVGAR
ncbi:MAG: sugar transferase [Gemmatimonadota bacterium]